MKNNGNNCCCGGGNNSHPQGDAYGTNIDMNVCNRNINMLPMIQTYNTIVLKPNICCKKNILTQEMMTCEDCKYVIRWDYDLNGQTITVPERCILEFDGGTLSNGTIVGQDTLINNMGDLDNIFKEDCVREGTWRNHFEKGGSGGGGGLPDKPYDPLSYSGYGRKTLSLKEGGSNVLTQGDFDQDNTIYVIPFDFSLGGGRSRSITFDASTVSTCESPLYRSEVKKLELMQVEIGKTIYGVEITDALIAEQQQKVANTPRYYYYQSVDIPAGKALLIDGMKFVVLNTAKTAVDRYAGKVLCGAANKKVNIATVYPGTYTFTEIGHIKVPQNSILDFEGGSIDDGAVEGNYTKIINDGNAEIFKDGIYIAGSWEVDEIFDTWFEYNYQSNVAKNEVIENILHLTNDYYYSVINFISDRNYLVELKEIPIEHLGGVRQNMLEFFDWTITKNHTSNEAPWTDDITLFNLPSNTKIVLESTITMLPAIQPFYRIFMGYDNSNITIEGNGTIYGDVHSYPTRHDYSLPYRNNAVNQYQGEYGHIFLLCGCKDVNISGITLSGAFGDNIMVWYGIHDKDTRTSFVPVGSAYVSDRVNIFDTKVEWARRNGIAVAARNVTIENSKFRKNGSAQIYGTSPKAHIDFESNALTPNTDYGYPGYPECGNENCVARNCYFEKFTHDDVYILDTVICENYDSSYEDTSVTVEDCDINILFLTDHNKNVIVRNCNINNLQYPNKGGKGESEIELYNIQLMGCTIQDINPMLLNSKCKTVDGNDVPVVITEGCRYKSIHTETLSLDLFQNNVNSKIADYPYDSAPDLPNIGNILHLKLDKSYYYGIRLRGWITFYRNGVSRVVYVDGTISRLDQPSFSFNVRPTGSNAQNSGVYKLTPYYFVDNGYTDFYLSLLDESAFEYNNDPVSGYKPSDLERGIWHEFSVDIIKAVNFNNTLTGGATRECFVEIVNALPENTTSANLYPNLCNQDVDSLDLTALDKTYDGVVLVDGRIYTIHNKKAGYVRVSSKDHVGPKSYRPVYDDNLLYRGFDYLDTDLNKMLFAAIIYTQETATTEFPAGTVRWIDGKGFSAAPSKGNSASRPKARHIEEIGGEQVFVGELTRNDLGFEYFDLDLRRYIYANYIYDIDYEATHHDKPVGTVVWVDGDGFTATIRKGTSAQRAALLTGDTTGLTPIEAECIVQLTTADEGFSFYDKDLHKVCYLKNDNGTLSWTDALGDAIV